MALPSPYLAAENSATERRSRALHRFIVASPILLLIAIGLVGHLRKTPYRSPAGSSTYDAQVLAFRERVTATQDLHIAEDAPASDVVLYEAQRWVEGQKAGRLVSIAPAAYEDHLRDGVRGEILRTGLGLSNDLLIRANRAFEGGASDQAFEASVTAAELAHGLRGFEVQALLQSMVVERRALYLIARIWPKLGSAQRETTRRRLQSLLTDPKEVDGLALLERTQLVDYGQRQRIPVQKIVADNMRDEITTAARRSLKASNDRLQAILAAKATTPLDSD